MFYFLSWVMSLQVLVLLYTSLLTYTVPYSCLHIKYFTMRREYSKGRKRKRREKGKKGKKRKRIDTCNVVNMDPLSLPGKATQTSIKYKLHSETLLKKKFVLKA